MRISRLLTIPVAAAGFAAAALTGIAAGSAGHALNVRSNVKDTMRQNQLVTAVVHRGLAVYYLGGESKSHPLCMKSNGCFSIWKPVTVGSKSKLSKSSQVKGKLGLWNRNGFHQVTLSGKPLYTFSSDSKGVAQGDTITSFGGTWHVVTISSGGTTTSPGNTTPTTPTTPTCLYPPCY